jgi:hypothetical protein
LSAFISIRGFNVRTDIVGGIRLCLTANATLINDTIPAAGSRCPTFDFTDPTTIGLPFSRPTFRTYEIDLHSTGSPTSVPVPCAST